MTLRLPGRVLPSYRLHLPLADRPPTLLPLGSPLRAVRRILVYLLLTAALIPVQAAALALGARLRETLPVFYHGLCCRLFGIRIVRRGRLSATRPTLFVCNHSSYLDIMVFSALMPVSFVAKAEVAGWPLFGLLAKLQRTVFVDRQRRSTRSQRDSIARRLAAGDNLILFPEGTSNDGNRILPFRSALFAVAEGPGSENLAIQPVSLAYTRVEGMPVGHGWRPLLAWYGDMDMASHLWRVAGLARVTAEVEFHPPVSLAQFGSRKALAEHCQHEVARGVARALAGRSAPPQALAAAV